MKKIACSVFSIIVLLTAAAAFAQQAPSPMDLANSAIQEMQKTDPQSAQAFQGAIQRGDLLGAKKIYQDFKKAQQANVGSAVTSEATGTLNAPAPIPPPPSLFERTLAGNLTQFGYELFNKTVATFTAPTMLPVGPDYIIGPGDQFTLTLWGTTEGIYSLQVTKEGQVTLPKVGVVNVAGIRFGELERTLKRHLSKYYSNFNLSVAMGGLKTLTIYVVGEVSVPGSFSLPSLTTVYGALFAAGGPTKQGTLRKVQILRAGKVVKTLDLYDFLLKGDRSQDIRLQNEDTVFVPLIGPVAGVAGAVYRPAIYELKGGETIDTAIKTAGGIMPLALGGRLQLIRYVDNQKKVILDMTIDDPPADAAKSDDNAAAFNEKVRNMDTIIISPVYDKVWETVNLSGTVQHPGDYQWRPDIRVKEIIDQGGLLPISDLRRAEVVRLSTDLSDRQILAIDLGALMKGDEKQNILLQPQDQVRVYSEYKQAPKVLISGEVVRPGTYEVMNGERLSDLLRRVGGMTVEGYAYGAVFKRKTVQSTESKNLQGFIAKMQSQMLITAAGSAATAISAEEASFSKAELALNQSLLNNLKTMQEQAEGRVAVNITGNIEEWAGSKDDLILQDGDSLFIPKKPQEVMVVGEVYSPGAQIFQVEMTVKGYLERTGGFTKNADLDGVFVVQANGFAYGAESPNIGNIEKAKLQPGDAIFVPQKLERYATMRNTRDIVDILFKTAVVIATITILV